MVSTELFPDLGSEITELDVLLMSISVSIPAGSKRHVQLDKLRRFYKRVIYKCVVRQLGNSKGWYRTLGWSQGVTVTSCLKE